MRRKRIENQVILLIILIIVLVVGGCMISYYAALDRSLESKIRQEISYGREGVKAAIDDRKRRSRLTASLMASNPDVGHAIEKADRLALVAILRSYRGRLDVDLLSAINVDGVILAQLEPSPGGRAVRPRDGEPVFLNPVFMKSVGGRGAAGIELCLPDLLCVDAYAPVIAGGSEGGIIGYVRAGFSLGDGFARDVRRTTGTDVILLRRNRAYASSIPSDGLPRAEVLKLSDAIADLQEDEERAGGILQFTLGTEPYALKSTLLRDAAGRVLGRRIVGRSTKGVARARREGTLLLLGVALIAAAMALGVSVFIARRIFSPLRALTRSVKDIAEGRSDAVIRARRSDEIGELANAFNDAYKALSEREKSLRDTAEQLRVNQEQLIQSGRLAAVGELAAGVAHEIGNPLSAISGYAQMLRKIKGADGKTKDFAREIEREAEFIERIISDLLDFSRPARSRAGESVDPRELLSAAVKTVSNHKAFSKVKVEKYFPDGVARVTCNKKEIIQVFLNLLMNAAQAMPGGGTIRVRCGMTADEASFRVSDDGPGVDEDVRAHIFDPFFTTKPPGIGTGLGLSISYRIIEKHGGRLSVVDSPRGACFEFTLPAGK